MASVSPSPTSADCWPARWNRDRPRMHTPRYSNAQSRNVEYALLRATSHLPAAHVTLMTDRRACTNANVAGMSAHATLTRVYSLAMRRILLPLLFAATLLKAQSGKPFEIMETTIEQVHAAYKSGKLTARQLVQSYLDRIRA